MNTKGVNWLIKERDWAIRNGQRLAKELVKVEKQRDNLLTVCEIFVNEVFDDKDLWKLISCRGEKYETWLYSIVEKAKKAIAEVEKQG